MKYYFIYKLITCSVVTFFFLHKKIKKRTSIGIGCILNYRCPVP